MHHVRQILVISLTIVQAAAALLNSTTYLKYKRRVHEREVHTDLRNLSDTLGSSTQSVISRVQETDSILTARVVFLFCHSVSTLNGSGGEWWYIIRSWSRVPQDLPRILSIISVKSNMSPCSTLRIIMRQRSRLRQQQLHAPFRTTQHGAGSIFGVVYAGCSRLQPTTWNHSFTSRTLSARSVPLMPVTHGSS